MSTFSRVTDIELICPTSIGLRLVDEEGAAVTDQIVISPVHFITDFSVFLTAVRSGGETRPIDAGLLQGSWEEAREVLRQRLIEEDPWGEPPEAGPEEEGIVAAGEERLRAIQARRGGRAV